VVVTAFEVRQAQPEDARALAELFAAVAEERDRIATEPPVDVDKRTTQFAAAIDGTIVSVACGDCVGSLHIFGNTNEAEFAVESDRREGARRGAAQALAGGHVQLRAL
jgi:hypothetical protein